MRVGLVLVGRALDYLPYFIYAFEEMGQRGLGAGRGKAALQRVIALGPEPSDDRCIYQTGTGQLESDYPVGVGAPDTEAVGTRLRLRMHTPLRLKNEGRYTRRLTFPYWCEPCCGALRIWPAFTAGPSWTWTTGSGLSGQPGYRRWRRHCAGTTGSGIHSDRIGE